MRRGAEPRGRYDERHPHLLFVDRRAVVAAAVIAELLAVIGGDHEDRARAGARGRRLTISPTPSSAAAISLS